MNLINDKTEKKRDQEDAESITLPAAISEVDKTSSPKSHFENDFEGLKEDLINSPQTINIIVPQISNSIHVYFYFSSDK